MTTEPFTVARLREMMEHAPAATRQDSTVLWAADEIERLRHNVDLLVTALAHRNSWSGTECMCDEDPCPGFPDV
jgi:hypothetical protein